MNARFHESRPRRAIPLTIALLVTPLAGLAGSPFAFSQPPSPRFHAELKTEGDSQQIVIEANPPLAESEQSDWGVEVRLAGTASERVPPMAGQVEFDAAGWRFLPRFPLLAGRDYEVRIVSAKAPIAVLSVTLPPSFEGPPQVRSVFPSGEALPENTLRFYIHFDRPMQQGSIYDHCSIERADGTVVEIPFLELEQELWSRDGTRVTLLLDPGRIKRGLKPREEMGPIFSAGHRYRLVIDGGWKDAAGTPMGPAVTREFEIGPEDHVQPDPARWKLNLPPAGGRDPIRVLLDEPLDQAMLMRVVQIQTAEGDPVSGEVTVGDGERTWQFVPDQPWQSGAYQLHVDNRLEDRAGNSIEKPFDVDVFERVEPLDLGGATRIPFSVR